VQQSAGLFNKLGHRGDIARGWRRPGIPGIGVVAYPHLFSVYFQNLRGYTGPDSMITVDHAGLYFQDSFLAKGQLNTAGIYVRIVIEQSVPLIPHRYPYAPQALGSFHPAGQI